MAKRFLTVLICCLLLLSMVPGNRALAAGFIDTDRKVTLEITAEKAGVKLQGAQFDLYLIAEMDAYGEISVTEDFARFNLDIRGENDEAWNEVIQLLESYLPIAGIEPTDSGKTDQNGLLTFPTGDQPLVQGIYLVVGHSHTQDGIVYIPASFLVSLPGRSAVDDSWIYDVQVSPKFESHPEKEETITRKVLKVWKDEGYEDKRPKEIVVYLLKDGSIYDEVVLNEENNWSHTWEGLDPNAKWAVAENAMKDYAVEITRTGVTFVITNRYASAPPPSTTPGGGKLPQTGQLWWPVPVLLALGLLMIILGMLRRRGYDYEK